MSGLDVLLVGAGWAARRHAEAVTRSGDRVAVVVEPDADRGEGLARRLGAERRSTLDEWRALGPGVDMAVIASPSSEHLRQTLNVVRQRIPVLVEKPHRLPGEDATELLDTARDSAVPVQIGLTTRYRAGMQRLHSLLAEGALGEPAWVTDRICFDLRGDQLAPWYFDRRSSGGGVLVTNGVHALDRVGWLLGEPLELGSAELRTLMPGRDVEDAALLQLSTASGISVTITLLWAPFAVPESELRVVASRGSAALRADGSWTISTTRQPERRGGAELELEAFERQWTAFRATVVDREAPDPGLDAGERALTLIEAAYASREPAWQT